MYDVIGLVGYDPVLCLLALLRSQETEFSSNGGEDPLFFGCDFKTGQLFDVSPLRANKKSRMGSGVTVDVPGRAVRRLSE